MSTAVDVGTDAQYKRAPVEAVALPRLRSVRVEGCSASRVALAIVFLAAVVAAFIVLDEHVVADVMEWMRGSTVEGAALFVGLYIVSIVLFIPGSVLALCGGALFKWHWGTLLVWVGQSIGQVIAFVIGRYLLRDAVVANVTTRYPKFAAIDAALEREGWRLVVMMRLSPLVPWNVLNYLLSITGVSFVSYSLASCASVLPWLSLFTYLGSMATTAADVLSGQAAPAGQTRVAVAAASGVLLVAAVVYTGVVAKRAITDVFGTLPGSVLDAEEQQPCVELVGSPAAGDTTHLRRVAAT